MPAKPSETIDIDSVKTVAQVLVLFKKLQKQLPKVGLSQWLPFNHAYQIVTEQINQAAEEDYFENPDFIDDFSVCFAKYYFRAVNEELQSASNTIIAWHRLQELHSSHPTTALLMGANAHINHDLPLALAETMPEQTTEGLLGDVRRVDKLLMKSGKLIIASFDEQGAVASWIKKNLQFMYYRPTMYMILLWRVSAWRNYKKIATGKSGNQAERSAKIAKRFLWLDKISAKIA